MPVVLQIEICQTTLPHAGLFCSLASMRDAQGVIGFSKDNMVLANDGAMPQGTLYAVAGDPVSVMPEPTAQTYCGNIGKTPGLLVSLILIFLLVAYTLGSYRKVLASFAQNLASSRHGGTNLFDDTLTAGEARVLFVLILQLCFCMGVLMFVQISSFSLHIPDSRALSGILILAGIFAVYYLLQWGIYGILGHVFADEEGAMQLDRNFRIVHSFLGLLLLVPAMISIFYQSAVSPMLVIAAALYIIARIVFIYKSFRIFYHNFSSLLYFILYLCAIEIIPVKLIYSSCLYLLG